MCLLKKKIKPNNEQKQHIHIYVWTTFTTVVQIQVSENNINYNFSLKNQRARDQYSNGKIRLPHKNGTLQNSLSDNIHSATVCLKSKKRSAVTRPNIISRFTHKRMSKCTYLH